MKKAMLEIINTLQANGHEAVLAGGCVRDMLLNIEPHDYDIATSAIPDEVEALFKNTKAVGKSFGVILVRKKGIDFEVATFRSDGNYSDGRRPDSIEFVSMEEDAKRRDFTVNALFFDPIADKIFDFVGGQRDLKEGRLNFVGNPYERIQEDKLRILRFIRFLVKLDFFPESISVLVVKDMAELIKEIASERVREEFIKMLDLNKPRKVIELLFKFSLIHHMLPSVAALENEEQNPVWHPEGTALVHTLEALKYVKDENYIIKLAVLLHDIGKPKVHKIHEGRIVTPGHAAVGAEMVKDILTDLRFPNNEIELISWLVGSHMLPAHKMRKCKLKRLLAHPHIEDLIKVMRADKLGSLNNNPDKTVVFEFLKAKLIEWTPEEIKPEPLISGKDLIALGLKPSPLFKEILNNISDMQLEGIISTKEEAIKLVKIDKN